MNLYDYQVEALNNMSNKKILYGPTGSGKSIVGLSYYIKICKGSAQDGRAFTNPLDLYIITPAKKRDELEWEREFINSGVIFYKDSVKMVVDSWNNIKKYVDIKNGFFIFDEQRLVGSGSWVKSFLKISKNNQWIMLTATPGDKWTDYIPVFVANGFYKSRHDFTDKHIVYKPFVIYPVILRYNDTNKLNELKKKVLVQMNYHTDLKIRIWEQLAVEHTLHDYKTVQRDRWDPWKNKPIENTTEYFYCLRKAVNLNPYRAKKVVDLAARYERVIVFYNFEYELELLKSMLIFENVYEYNGHKHDKIPLSGNWVYLVQYNLNDGWNCQQADTVIFYSLNYSYKVLLQAAGRIDRVDSKYNVLHYFQLYTKTPIDRAILTALKNKKNFFEGKF